MPVPTNQPDLNDLEWDSIIDGIGKEQCVICLGPEFFILNDKYPNEEQEPVYLSDLLSKYLENLSSKLNIKIQENGWFHLNQGGYDGPAYQAIKAFYYNKKRHQNLDLLEKLSLIKFHLFLSLTPDYHLRNIFVENNLPHIFDSYTRNKPDKSFVTPDIEKPLIYNLLGEVDNRNSLVLTYDDFYDYLESVIKGNSMSNLIKENILNAQYYLFLGIHFDQWFVHLFMRILRQHKEKKNKYAAGGDLSEISKEQYHIKFINYGVNEFIEKLFKKCKDKGLVKDPGTFQQNIISRDSIVENLSIHAERNEFDLISKKLKGLLKGTGEKGKTVMINVNQLNGRCNSLRQLVNRGTVKKENEMLEWNKIREDYLSLIYEYQDTFISI